MSLRKPNFRISVEEYLESEKDVTVRHEYLDGIVYAMSGASDRHNLIAGAFYAQLLNHTGGGPCQAFIADMKVKVDQSLYYYPDVMVSCDPPGGDAYYRTQPILLVEVSSPNTERIDRHEKLTAYRRIPSLREYVLVSQDQMFVEVHRRIGDDWETQAFTQPGDAVNLVSVGLVLSLQDIYRHVRFDPQ